MKKPNSAQIDQAPEFENLKGVMKKILAVSKEELGKREQEYKRNRKQRPQAERAKRKTR